MAVRGHTSTFNDAIHGVGGSTATAKKRSRNLDLIKAGAGKLGGAVADKIGLWDLDPLVAAHILAHAFAEAFASARTAVRANKLGGINNVDPSVAITSGSSSSLPTFTFREGNTYGDIFSSPADDAAFCITSLKIDRIDMLEGNPAPLSALSVYLRQEAKVIPFVGMEFRRDVDVEIVVRNISGSSAVFHGFAITFYDDTCLDKKSVRPNPRFRGFRGLMAGLKKLVA